MPEQDPGTSPGGSGTGDLSIAVNGLFMQDHSAGEPWAQTVPSWEEPYVAKDGTAQIFSVTTPGLWQGATQQPTVDRIYPGKGSLTGWLKQSAPLTPDSLGPAFLARSRSQLLLVPGQPDRLVVYRNYSILVSQLGRDGSMGPLMPAGGRKPFSMPMVTGPIPEGSHYVPEIMSAGAGSTVVLRETKTFRQTFPITSEQSLTLAALGQMRKIWPLIDVNPDVYRCIALNKYGEVLFIVLQRNDALQRRNSDPAHPTFRLQYWEVLDQSSANGCVHVHNRQAGSAQVFLFDMPKIRTLNLTYSLHLINRSGYALDGSGRPIVPVGVSADVRSDPSVFRLPACPPGTSYEIAGAFHADTSMMDIFMLVRRPNMEADLCATTRTANGDWRQMLCIERGCRTASVFPFSGRVKLLLSRAIKTGNQQERLEYETWERSAKGYWAIDSAQLPKEGASIQSIPAFRIGIKLSQKSAGLPSEEIGITASLPTVADVNGHRTVIPTQEPLRAVTDSTGTVWVVLPLQDRLSFPDLQITLQRFTQKLELRPNGRLGSYLASLKATDLTAKDDKGKALISDPGVADTMASAVKSVVAAAPQPGAGVGTAPANVRITADLPYCWLGTGSSPSFGGRQLSAADPPPAWSLDRGGAGYRTISVADAQQRITREVRTLVLGEDPNTAITTITSSKLALSDIEDGLNWVGGRISDAVTAIANAASSVTSFVMDGAKLLIKLTISGIEYVYTGIVDTIHKALDAVACLFDYAGVALGQAANWLLEKLGFLFNWDAIKTRRDELRGLIKNNLNVVTQWLPNPTAAANTIVSHLSSFQANLDAYRSRPENATALSSRFSLAAGLPSLADVGGAAGLPKLNWLTDKMDAALSSLTGDFGIPQVDGMREATDALAETVSEVMDFLPAVLHSFDNAAGHWLDSTGSFVDRTGAALADILLDQVDRIIQLIERLILKAADAIAKLLAHPEAVIEWLDKKLSIPFFGGLYRGLTDHDLSFFDVACLAAAICAQRDALARIGPGRTVVDTNAASDAVRYFMYSGNVMSALDAAVSAALPGTPFSIGTSVLSLASLSGILVSTLIEKGDRWVDVAAGAGGLIAVALYGVYNKLFVIVGQVLLMLLRVAVTIFDAVNKDGRALAYNLVGIFQLFLNLVVNVATTDWTRTGRLTFNITRKPLDPIRSGVHGAVQYFLGGVAYNIHTGQPFISVQP